MISSMVATILNHFRSFLISYLSMIDLQSFSSDFHRDDNLSKFKFISSFVSKIKSGELSPGMYVNENFGHKHKSKRLFKIFLGFKLNNHINPIYGDYIFNVINPKFSPNLKPLDYRYQKISILIPTYGAVKDVENCIHSVIKAKTKVNWQLTVIDDASPDLNDRLEIRNLCQKFNVNFIQNGNNLGFVRTVNKFLESTSCDVLILNSDTEVYDHWLEAFVSVLDEKTGTVTTLSNNASIFSFKTHKHWDEDTTKKFAKSMSTTLADLWLAPIEVPTSHGYCMLITKKAINEVGLFDDISFGQGYGEENDYSFRVRQQGLTNLLTTRTFVYHKGSASFGDSNKDRKKLAEKVLLEKWPEYLKVIKNFLAKDHIGQLETHIRRFRALNPSNKVTFHISHGRGGGSDIALQNEVKRTISPDYVNYWIKPSEFPECIKLSVIDHVGEILLHDAIGYGPKLIAENFKRLKIANLVIHHVDGFHNKFIQDLIKLLDVPFEYRIHDYFTLCPFFNFVTESGEYCGQPNDTGCNKCIHSRLNDPFHIEEWRQENSKLLYKASNVTGPNSDVLIQFGRYHPDLNLNLRIPESNTNSSQKNLIPKKTMVVLGALSRAKGSDNLLEIIDQVSYDFDFYLIGRLLEVKNPELYQKLLDQNKLVELGEYKNDDVALDLIKRIDPIGFLFPGKIPETYSYTLDLALKFDKPIVACNIGAFSNRIPKEKFFGFETFSTPEEISQIISKNLF